MSYHAAHLGDVILEVSAVAKAYGETRALTSCSLTLRRGEILVLMGENGSGKSTLIKILSGVVRADRSTPAGDRNGVSGGAPRPGVVCPRQHRTWARRTGPALRATCPSPGADQ